MLLFLSTILSYIYQPTCSVVLMYVYYFTSQICKNMTSELVNFDRSHLVVFCNSTVIYSFKNTIIYIDNQY